MKRTLHLIEPDLVEFLAPDTRAGTWGLLAQLDQYMRLSAEFKDWLAERGEAE